MDADLFRPSILVENRSRPARLLPLVTPPTAVTVIDQVRVIGVPRCNFAGFCNFCDQRSCESPECIRMFEAALWAACERCDGHGGDGFGNRCLCCLWGAVEVTPAYLAARTR
jgi:hypothetical protein